MNRKNIIVVSAIANAVLLLVLFISAVVSHDDRKTPSSVEVASSILDKNPDGMVLLSQEGETAYSQKKESKLPSPQPLSLSSQELVPLKLEEGTTATAQVEPEHQLPEVVSPQVPTNEVVLVNPPVENFAVTKAPLEKKETFVDVEIKKGDSLDKLARKYHTSIQEIKKLNHLDGNFLQVGKVLRINVQEKTQKTSSVQNESKKGNEGEYYIIKHGDNPWTVAIKHHMKVEDLLRLNHLTKEKAKKLRPGDKLRIR